MEQFRLTPQTQNRFRSKGEEQIARVLDQAGVPYLYEHPLAVVDDGKVRLWYPDFQLPDYGILIEYFGRLDDPDYLAGTRKKQAVYEANGLAAVLLTPVAFQEDWPGSLLDEIEMVLVERLSRFQAARSANRKA